MAISEFEIKRCEKVMDAFLEARRPPAHIRSELDLCYRIDNQSIIIFEVRPVWNNPDEKVEINIAKATYIKKTKLWQVFWHKSDLKWHKYPPQPEVNNLEAFTELVIKDENCCFFG